MLIVYKNPLLEEIIVKLSSNGNIDALLLCGSTASGKQTKSSDHDLVLIVKEKPDKLLSLFTYIAGVPADIFFYSVNEVQGIISDKRVKDGAETWLMHWLEKGKIAFDHSGKLTELQKMVDTISTSLDASAGAYVYKINYNLVNNTRYFESEDQLYHAALEIRLMYSIVEVLTGYFSLRHIYWEGEKKAVQYLKDHDQKYLSVFERACRAVTLKDRFTAYLELTELTFTAEYPKWNKEVAVSIEGDFGGFWTDLLH